MRKTGKVFPQKLEKVMMEYIGFYLILGGSMEKRRKRRVKYLFNFYFSQNNEDSTF
jgi:hypothetical protein